MLALRSTLAVCLATLILTACTPDPAPTPAPTPVATPTPAPVAETRSNLTLDGSKNVLLIIADDVGVDIIQGYGEHPDPAATPHIDALIDDGVMFRNAWSNPKCSPARASILTGRHAYRHGVLYTDGDTLDGSEETVAEVADDAGYGTAMFGKWHLGQGALKKPTKQGFDYFSGALAGNVAEYDEWKKTTLEVGETDIVVDPETDYATEVNRTEAAAWINANNASPWFAVVAFNAGHSPYHKPPSGTYTRDLTGVTPDGNGHCVGADRHDCYRAMVESMDHEIGELFDAIGATEMADTYVIFVGDNGTPNGVIIDAPGFDATHGKGTMYEGGVNVPFVISGPGVTAGLVDNGLVQALDIFSTISDIVDGSPTGPLDSESLVSRLEVGAASTTPRTTLYTELHSSGVVDKWTVTDGATKYVYNDGTEACYRLIGDPDESDDRWGDGTVIDDRCDDLKAERPCLPSSCP